MTASWKSACLGAALALCAFTLPASAQRIVPAGYTTYYFSGTTADPVNPNLPAGAPGRMGDTVQQADNILNKLQAMLAKNNLGFGDVVSAHVFLVGDPAKGGDIDFAGLNAEWGKRFGTAEQPNRPSRVAIHVALPTAGALVEIELVAAKQASPLQ
jgi:enamine deaminase RidA (YjgF/YER057c/UK114 family)